MITISDNGKKTAPEKPPYGTACNGCGACCAAELCFLGQKVFGREAGPCPAMAWNDGKFECGLLVKPEAFASRKLLRLVPVAKLKEATAFLIGSGFGCDAQFDGEPDAPAEYRARLDAMRTQDIVAKGAKMLARWLGMNT